MASNVIYFGDTGLIGDQGGRDLGSTNNRFSIVVGRAHQHSDRLIWFSSTLL